MLRDKPSSARSNRRTYPVAQTSESPRAASSSTSPVPKSPSFTGCVRLTSTTWLSLTSTLPPAPAHRASSESAISFDGQHATIKLEKYMVLCRRPTKTSGCPLLRAHPRSSGRYVTQFDCSNADGVGEYPSKLPFRGDVRMSAWVRSLACRDFKQLS